MPAKPKLSFNAPSPAKAGGSTERRPDRIGKRLLQAHLPATTVIELKILAAKKGVSVVSLVEEAVASGLHEVDRLVGRRSEYT